VLERDALDVPLKTSSFSLVDDQEAFGIGLSLVLTEQFNSAAFADGTVTCYTVMDWAHFRIIS